MTATIGLERLPRSIRALLAKAAENLEAATDDLAHVVRDRPTAAPLAHREDASDRIVHELEDELRRRRRVGPDAVVVLALAQAIDDVVDNLDELGRAWARHPITELAPPVLAARDAARATAPAITSLETDASRVTAKLERCRERRLRARQTARDGREWPLVGQRDSRVAVLGHELLRRVDAVIGASGRLARCVAKTALGSTP